MFRPILTTGGGRIHPGIAILALLVLPISCHSSSRLDTEKWRGRTLLGQEIVFSSLKSRRIVVSAYSPTCPTCIADLQAVNLLYRAVQGRGMPFFIIVAGNPAAHGLTGPEAGRNLEEILRADVQRYAIEPPVVVLSPSFQIAQSDTLIRGTPETWILATRPLSPVYGFVGSIAGDLRMENIEEDSRFQFVRQKVLREIGSDRARAVKKR